ncbi:5621_t:CDS:2 [Racocetra fulgida]|uniref:5621_t:CDS:1 n=1 Tax=Racocetra fulgida TaxID=60492 RepID=A0A9N8ZS12_9GLOM|nr:5621_t:CDS:2 [Racocetra fulgida]
MYKNDFDIEEKTASKEYLDNLYLSSQINQFAEQMKEAIKTKQKEIDDEEAKKKESRKKAVEQIEKYCEETFKYMEEELPSVQKAIKKFFKKIKETPVDDLSSVIAEAQKFIDEERNKIKRLY